MREKTKKIDNNKVLKRTWLKPILISTAVILSVGGISTVGTLAGRASAENSANQQIIEQGASSSSSTVSDPSVQTATNKLTGTAADDAKEMLKNSNFKYSTKLTGDAKTAQSAIISDSVASVKEQQENSEANAKSVTKKSTTAQQKAVISESDPVELMRVGLRNNMINDSKLSDAQVRVLVGAYEHATGTDSTDTSETQSQWLASLGQTEINAMLEAAEPVVGK